MQRVFLFCFRSCLKGEDDNEYYNVLEIDDPSNATIDTIKRQYKKLSLSLHPDKLAQKGVEVTQEHKQKFLKVKEAYDVLSDPKRRKLYDELGVTGLKLVENPTEVDHTQLLKNFQKNRKDRFSIILLIALVFAAILILPILFSLKCDGDINNVEWTALWTPMWLVDIFLLVSAVAIMLENPEHKPPTESGEPAEQEEPIPLSEKIAYVLTTVSFVLLQIFIMMRLDKDIHWSWFSVFAPWFAYEAISVLSLVHSAFLTTIPVPNYENITLIVEEGHNPDEEMFMQKIQLESAYFQKVMQQKEAQRTVLVSLLRIWQAIFLALKLDGSRDWNWGLVFLPIWVHLFSQYAYAYFYRVWGLSKLDGLDVEAISAGADNDPISMTKLQHGRELLSSSFFSCLFQAIPLFMAIMLVCRLQVSSYSTFLIILPVFIIIGCCCCVVFCGICCLANVDMDELEKEVAQQRQGGGGAADGEPSYSPPNPSDVEIGATHTPNPSAAYGTFAPTAGQTNVVVTPTETPLQHHEPAPQPHIEKSPVTNIDADID